MTCFEVDDSILVERSMLEVDDSQSEKNAKIMCLEVGDGALVERSAF